MTIDEGHPELPAEQAYVEHAYRCLETMLADVRELRYLGSDPFEEEAFDRFKRTRIAALSDTTSALVFGRIDERSGETFHIGRHHVRDADRDAVVVDWRAPVAESFYRASSTDPMGLWRRRRFLAEGRRLLGISDDRLDAPGTASDARADEILQRELERRRGGMMRDVVATIQAEQDVIIRSPLRGVVVVQGGPGTGKTVVGLHRAAYLLYEHRNRLERTGVLVVGPNPVFVRYVSEVLPSLGESAVTQLPIDALSPVPVRGTEAPEVARLKGDARMATVVDRALADRRRPVSEDVELAVGSVRFVLPAADVEAEADGLRERGVVYREGRERLRDALLVTAHRRYSERLHAGTLGEGFDTVTREVRRHRSFRSAVDRVWPSVASDRLVRDLLASPSRLERAGDGILTVAERRLLRRRRAPKGADEPWTSADGPLVDEARALIEGPPDRYGHVICDEAQDLSPMQLRMLARRCRSGSVTALGDLGQATGVWAHDDWDQLLEHLPTTEGARTEELTLGYRVSAEITELAAAILRETAPSLRPPTSVRRERGRVQVIRSQAAGLPADVADAAHGLLEDVPGGAVLVPRALLNDVRAALRERRLPFGEADRGELTKDLTLVPVDQAKGLEFEGVVVVEPSRVVSDGGLRLLYVAVTRAMRRLVVVHAEELPPALRSVRERASA